MKSILDPSFHYTSFDTGLRKTFARIRREQKRVSARRTRRCCSPSASNGTRHAFNGSRVLPKRALKYQQSRSIHPFLRLREAMAPAQPNPSARAAEGQARHRCARALTNP